MLGWDLYGLDKKHTRTRYSELVFFHSVGSACHVVNSGVSGARNIDALFYFAQVGPARIGQKAHRDTLR
jgi:hypothetical protein